MLAETREGVLTLTLNRPEAMNAITTRLARELGERLAGEGEHGAIVIRGAGGNFCAGGDFNHVQELRDDPAALRALFEAFSRACTLIGELPVPVLAAVDGAAMAGGFELMQSCDFALVAEDARIGDNHSNHGMIPGGGSTQRLPRLVGPQRALALILTGERLSGAEAVEWGLAYRAHPAAELHNRAAELAQKLAAKDRRALARTKALIREGLERPLAEGLRAEIDATVEQIGGGSAEAEIDAFTAGEAGSRPERAAGRS